MARNASGIRELVRNAGAIFVGSAAAEVFGDYGIGPNHTLPTSKAARYRGGLSVYDFLKIRTFVNMNAISKDRRCHDDYRLLVKDTIQLAKLEGLHGHAMAAEMRLKEFSKIDFILPVANDVFSAILRSDLNSLMEYHPVKPLKSIVQEIGVSMNQISKLNANENSYGPPSGMAEAVKARIKTEASFYPDPDQIELRSRLAIHTGRRIEEIVCGAGNDTNSIE